MPQKNNLKLEQERTRKLKEEVEQMEKVALQFTSGASSAASIQSVTFAGLGTAITSGPASQKSGQAKPRTTSGKPVQPSSAPRQAQVRVPMPPHASHGPMASTKLTSSSTSSTLVKPNAIKSPLPAISSRPSSGTISVSRHQVVQPSKHLSTKPQRPSAGIGGTRSRKSSANSSQANSRKSSISGPEETVRPTSEAVTKQSTTQASDHKPAGHILRKTSSSANPQSVSEFLMREGENFTLGKDIFLKGDLPISTACDMAIGDDSQLELDPCDPSPPLSKDEPHIDSTTPPYQTQQLQMTNALAIPLEEQSPKQQRVRFEVAEDVTEKGAQNSSSAEACGTANEAETSVPYFAQIEKAIVLKTLTELSRAQESPEERHARLLKVALHETPAPIEGIDDDLNAELVISPEDIMAELATLVN